MRTQRFGIEIEMTGITREKAAETIAAYFGRRAFTSALTTRPTGQRTGRGGHGKPPTTPASSHRKRAAGARSMSVSAK